MKTMQRLVLVFLTILIGASQEAPAQSDKMVCAEYLANPFNAPPPSDDDYIYDDGEEYSSEANAGPPAAQQPVGTVKCSPDQQYCYSVWKLDAIGNATIIRQGCWQSDEQHSTCQSERCISGSPNAVANGHRFCCCSGPMCNQNTTIIVAIHSQTTAHAFDGAAEDEDSSDEEMDGPFRASQMAALWSSPVVWICLVVTGTIVIAIGALLAISSTKKCEAELAPLAQALAQAGAEADGCGNGSAGPGYSSTAQCVDNLQLCSMIGRGRYGTVWKGLVNDREVAVKIFPAQHRQYFLTERNIYTLDLMENPGLLEYYGSDTRRTMNDQLEHLLVLALAPNGCLQDWLTENTCTFNVFTLMAKSVIAGLAHLHTEMRSSGADGVLREKPCICHRDLNTRNILVRADLSCCIADFGFALKMYGARYEWKGEIALAETKSVAEVGTLRYMAPEVLEGAVNLRECETALKQIDVYALGLVLWELCTRCTDWYPAADENGAPISPPAYQAPYEAEIGKHPTFEHMQILVSRHKVRPQFAASWGGAAASARLARETCEECWDHDAEARLTVMCAEERMNELAVLGPTAQSSRSMSPVRQAQTMQHEPHHSATTDSPQHPVQNTQHNNLYQNDVTTAIITPPNQIIPTSQNHHHHVPMAMAAGNYAGTQLAQVVTIGERRGDYCGNNNSVEELLTSSSSTSASCDSVDGAGGIAAVAGQRQSRRSGWYGVRALIQKNLFKRNGAPVKKRGAHGNVNTIEHPAAAQHMRNAQQQHHHHNQQQQDAAPLVVQLRPCNLKIDQQQQQQQLQQLHSDQHHLAATLPRTIAVLPIITALNDNSAHHSVSCTAIANEHDHNATSAYRPPRIVISKSATTVLQPSSAPADADMLIHPNDDSTPSPAQLRQIKRQRSLDMFHEVFGAKGSIERLRDPAQRVKTPGDVPAAVRRMRASKTLSLYDDRMMSDAAIVSEASNVTTAVAASSAMRSSPSPARRVPGNM